MTQILLKTDATPGTPAAGVVSIYAKVSDKKLYFKDETGVESLLSVASYTDRDKVTQVVSFAAASSAINCNSGLDVVISALTADLTMVAPTNGAVGDTISLHFIQDGFGGHKVTLPAVFKGPFLSSGVPGSKLVARYRYDGTDWVCTAYSGWDGVPATGGEENAVVASRTATLADIGMVIACNSTVSINITIPPLATLDFPTGTILTTYQAGAGASTFVAGAGVTIEGTAPTAVQYGYISVRNRSGNVWSWVGGSSGGSGGGGGGSTSQSVLFASMSASANLASGNIVNVIDAVTADVTIAAPTNIPLGIFGWSWFQDATGGRTITLPNGATISGGLPGEIQYAYFINTGTNQLRLANG
jgi:hypothetical protein